LKLKKNYKYLNNTHNILIFWILKRINNNKEYIKMNSNKIYLIILVLVCSIQSSLSQKYSKEPTIQEVNSKEVEQSNYNIIFIINKLK